jgi:formylglycine-generating enzyme required for sulfatase activity
MDPRALAAAVAVAVLLGPACSGNSPASKTCEPACAAGQSCVDGQCTTADAGTAGADAGTSLSTCPTGYVRVEPGTFTMGSPTAEPGRGTNEGQHQVTLTRPFCLKATEVTRDEFFAAMAYHPNSTSTCGATCPETKVRWMEAGAWCNALSRRDGLDTCYDCTGSMATMDLKCPRKAGWISCRGYRLPSEAEWEYAARAGSTQAFANGDFTPAGFCESTTLAAVAWFCGNSNGALHPVGGKQANGWGLFDMSGNALEWTNDSDGDYPTGAVTDPVNATGAQVVLRGGAFDLDPAACRLAARAADDAGDAAANQGFRPVRFAQ